MKKINIANWENILFLSISLSIFYLLIYNLFHYDQIFGYDGEAHSAYVDNFLNMYIPGRTNQPSINLTYEFFSPPLPYALPTFFNEICKMYLWSNNLYPDCRDFYSFNNIIFQSILFILTLFLYMKIIKLLTKSNKLINVNVLLVIAIFTANYRTISMLRGEIYIIFLNGFLLYRFLLLLKKSFNYERSDIFLIGSTIGLLALSRQWAFLLFPAYFVIFFLITNRSEKKKYFSFLFYVFSIGFVLSSWFYFNLFFEYGTFTAFNKEAVPFKLSNQPLSFYLPYGDEVHMVFTKPIRPYFMNQFIPILFADLWGDYWGYFTFTSRALDLGRNQLLIGDYLARVNIFSLIPTFLLLLGFKWNFKYLRKREKEPKDYFLSYLCLATLFSFFGYLWFLIDNPEPSGDTIKATYILHLFHLLGLLAVFYLEKLKERNKKYYQYWVFGLLIVFIHNFSAMMSHFPFQEKILEIFYFY